jgi:hypothetical protein
MRNVWDKCRENPNTPFMSNNFFSSLENRVVYYVIFRNVVDRGRPQMAVWRIACWITKATDTHSECVEYLLPILLSSSNNFFVRPAQVYIYRYINTFIWIYYKIESISQSVTCCTAEWSPKSINVKAVCFWQEVSEYFKSCLYMNRYKTALPPLRIAQGPEIVFRRSRRWKVLSPKT